MDMPLPPLPIGNPLFEELRQENAVYVDKTMYLPELRKKGRFIFCARPRRFGKSLTVSALDAFYSGRKELFRGLAAEKTVCLPDFVSRPVIRLDMSHVAGSESKEILIKRLMRRLGENAARHNVTLRGADYPDTFSCLLKDVHDTSGQKAVLLIDEYDAPLINLIEKDKRLYDSKMLDVTRDVMQDFYTQIKASVEDIELAFITGITKFSRTGVFSKLNGLIDITLSPKFGAFMGYTHEELKTSFAPFITAAASELEMSEEKLLDEIRDYYDGFSFDGSVELYNPFSVLSFFDENEFGNFWMESGSNTFIRTFLRDKALTADQFQGKTVDYNFARTPGEIDATSPEGFLYQSGYLTLRRLKGEKKYILEYPNREVREAISTLFLQNVISDWGGTYEAGRNLSTCLASGDVPGMISVLRQLLASVCYYDHLDASRGPQARTLQ
ncbi:MAG: AAA family ATPase, partial [Deltaproteobacteria bacterium]|nr:AAA family ATPase [Deltaproteobacteria bacterium]